MSGPWLDLGAPELFRGASHIPHQELHPGQGHHLELCSSSIIIESICNFLFSQDLLRRILVLIKSRHTFLKVRVIITHNQLHNLRRSHPGEFLSSLFLKSFENFSGILKNLVQEYFKKSFKKSAKSPVLKRASPFKQAFGGNRPFFACFSCDFARFLWIYEH